MTNSIQQSPQPALTDKQADGPLHIKYSAIAGFLVLIACVVIGAWRQWATGDSHTVVAPVLAGAAAVFAGAYGAELLERRWKGTWHRFVSGVESISPDRGVVTATNGHELANVTVPAELVGASSASGKKIVVQYEAQQLRGNHCYVLTARDVRFLLR